MSLETWLAFFVASWLISLSPGAGAISCMAAGMRYGYARAFWNIVGLQFGILFVLLIVALGLGAIIAASTTLFTAIKWLGAAYLVYLGVMQWRAPASQAWRTPVPARGTARPSTAWPTSTSSRAPPRWRSSSPASSTV